jgi:hypothetical protein
MHSKKAQQQLKGVNGCIGLNMDLNFKNKKARSEAGFLSR